MSRSNIFQSINGAAAVFGKLVRSHDAISRGRPRSPAVHEWSVQRWFCLFFSSEAASLPIVRSLGALRVRVEEEGRIVRVHTSFAELSAAVVASAFEGLEGFVVMSNGEWPA